MKDFIIPDDRDLGTGARQHAGKMLAEAAGGARHQGHAAG